MSEGFIGYNIELVSIEEFHDHYRVVIRHHPGFFERKFSGKKPVDYTYISIEKVDKLTTYRSFFDSDGNILDSHYANIVSNHINKMKRDKKHEELKKDLKELYSKIVNEEKK